MDGAMVSGPQYSGPTTTANSQSEGRLKVDAGGMKKRKILKKAVKKVADGQGGPADLNQMSRVTPENRTLYSGNSKSRIGEITQSNKSVPVLSKPSVAPFRPGDKFKNPAINRPGEK